MTSIRLQGRDRSLWLVVGLPILIAAAACAWAVPLSSAHTAGYGLGIALFVDLPLVAVWIVWALINGVIAFRTRRGKMPALHRPAAELQILQMATVLVGAVPLLSWNLDPDLAAATTGFLTSFVCPIVGLVALIAQTVLLQRRRIKPVVR